MKKLTNQRSCVGCKKKGNKFEFRRVVFFSGKLMIDDEKQNTPGRGCYLCAKNDCLMQAIKRNAFNYRLKQKVSKEELERFLQEFKKILE